MNKALFSFVVLLSLSACGKSAKEDFVNKLNGLSNDKALFFSGNYHAPCQSVDFGGQKLYQTETLQFSGMDISSGSMGNPAITMSAFSDESTLFLDSSCSKALAVQKAKGKYTFGNENREVTFEANQLNLSSKDSSMTAALNSQNFCGFSDWKNDTSKDLMNGSCGADMKNMHFYFNSHDEDASVIDLIVCSDEEMKDCAKMTYFKTN